MKKVAIVIITILSILAISGCTNFRTAQIESLIDSLDREVVRYRVGCDQAKTPPCEICIGLAQGVDAKGEGKNLAEAWEDLTEGLRL